MTEQATAEGRPFTGRQALLLALAFFGVIIAVNVTMAVLAFQSWTGLVTTNAYVEAQAFESQRLAHEAQLAAGWEATFTVADGHAELALHDAGGVVPALGTVTLKVSRPVGGQDDHILVLAQRPDGTYAAPLSLPAGIWDAQLEAPETALGPFILRTRFRIGAGK